jgi:hypothetical protein
MLQTVILSLALLAVSACTITYVVRRDWSDDTARAEAARDIASGKIKILCAGGDRFGGPLGLDMAQQRLVKGIPQQWFYRDHDSEYPYQSEALHYGAVYNLEICSFLVATNTAKP